MTTVDWVALGFVALMALAGLRRGLIASAFSIAAVAGGAIVGARLAPHLLSDGARSPYTPLVGLAGAVLFALFFQTAGAVVGGFLRQGLRVPPLRALDSLGGLLLGGAAGLAVVWIVGVAALQLPGHPELRGDARRSAVLQRLTSALPPERVLRALARIDPFPVIAGPAAPVAPPDPRLLSDPGVRAAAPSVVRVIGTACGVGLAGSGWIAGRGLVVTAAHVVAGQRDTVVQPFGSDARLRAHAVGFDARNDLAVLRVRALRGRALRLTGPTPGTSVAVLGYPENGPFRATAARLGRTTTVLAQDAYGRGPVLRSITAFRGRVRSGNSGGPAVDRSGAVQTTVFASRRGGSGGYGVPTDLVRRALRNADDVVSTGDCAR